MYGAHNSITSRWRAKVSILRPGTRSDRIIKLKKCSFSPQAAPFSSVSRHFWRKNSAQTLAKSASSQHDKFCSVMIDVRAREKSELERIRLSSASWNWFCTCISLARRKRYVITTSCIFLRCSWDTSHPRIPPPPPLPDHHFLLTSPRSPPSSSSNRSKIMHKAIDRIPDLYIFNIL